MDRYDHKAVEKKWQDRWDEAGVFRSDEDAPGKKFYVLDMFPYPSSNGLHVGHPEGYTATDIVARKRRMEGWNVLHPMGWDAFGLPAENYAIKIGGHPRAITGANIENFRRQIKSFGFSYDWSREIDTSSPEYYRWTQWLFLKLYERSLAYRKKAPVNWCETCKTVLANEQVEDGRCERCKNEVVQKELEQWFFRITDYAERLLADLDGLDWPEKIKTMQRNWLGRSEGAAVRFGEVEVFTTRPDTLFGVTAVVLAPEHPLVAEMTTDDRKAEVEEYVEAARKKSELDRTSEDEKEKTGVFTGATVPHPLTGEGIPVWVADYVLMGYGTGAVMVVPAHDDRDFTFARKFGLPIKAVVMPPGGEEAPADAAYTPPGFLANSGEFDGLASEEAKTRITEALEKAGKGGCKVTWHLRDWLISRQRYWGAPIPVIVCEACGDVPVPEKDLPVTLPDDVDFRPTGESPLARSKSFHDVACPKCGKKARRESDTMDTFVDSSWYFLRYCDPKNDEVFADESKVRQWCPVDLYVGGAEHAVLHLLYARFVTKALKDAGFVDFEEPFLSLRNQGLILGEDGEKMSKSRGNVVNPDEVIGEWGADVFRLFEMFMGEFEQAKPWNTASIVGPRRFLERVWKLSGDILERDEETDDETRRLLHKTVKKVTGDIDAFKFNTAIAAMMIFLNEAGTVSKEDWAVFLRILAPFAPHVAEELWERTGGDGFVSLAEWPSYDQALVAEHEVEIAVQVNGKVKDRLVVAKGASDEDVKAKALALESVRAALGGKAPAKVVVVKDRLVNIVA